MKYFSESFAKKLLRMFNIVLALQITFYLLGTLMMYLSINQQGGWQVSVTEPLAIVWIFLSAAVLLMFTTLLLFVKDKKQIFNRTTNILLVLFGIQLIILQPVANWIGNQSTSVLRP